MEMCADFGGQHLNGGILMHDIFAKISFKLSRFELEINILEDRYAGMSGGSLMGSVYVHVRDGDVTAVALAEELADFFTYFIWRRWGLWHKYVRSVSDGCEIFARSISAAADAST